MACMYLDGHLLLQAILYLVIFAAGLASSITSGLAKVRNTTDGCNVDRLGHGVRVLGPATTP